jgi:hypothetical protein
VPDNRIQIVKTDSPADHTDVRVEGKYQVTSKVTSCHTNITYHAHQPASGDKNTIDVPPNLLQFLQEALVVFNMSSVVRGFIVAFKIPIGW